jgi:hypothetical protein
MPSTRDFSNQRTRPKGLLLVNSKLVEWSELRCFAEVQLSTVWFNQVEVVLRFLVSYEQSSRVTYSNPHLETATLSRPVTEQRKVRTFVVLEDVMDWMVTSLDLVRRRDTHACFLRQLEDKRRCTSASIVTIPHAAQFGIWIPVKEWDFLFYENDSRQIELRTPHIAFHSPVLQKPIWLRQR